MTVNQGASQRTWRLGVVSYLNAKPLIAGLESAEDVALIYDVPARLSGLLERGKVDVALVPVIDLLVENRDWQIVSDACIGCDGETLTVRVFSRVEPERIQTLHVDGDSHTSVALATIIWRELYRRQLDIVPFVESKKEECEAVLLIGDKVVNHPPIGFDIETDLGSAWKSLTALPFVFAVWAGPRGRDVSALATRLGRARDLGVEASEAIAVDFGPGLGWPDALAKRYLTTRLKFTLGQRQRRGMARFLELAQAHDLVIAGKALVFA